MADFLRSPLAGWLAALGVVCIWSGWVVVSRLGVSQTVNAYDIMILRFAVAFIIVLPFIVRFWPRHLKAWQLAIIAGGQGIPYLLFAFIGFEYAPASHAGVMINGTLPIFAAVLGWIFLKDKPGIWRALGIAIILCGCFLISRDQQSGGVSDQVWLGHLLFMAAALTVAVYMIGAKAWSVSPLQALVVIPAVNLAVFLPVYLLMLPKAIMDAPWQEIIIQGGYQGIGPSILAVFLFTTSVQRIGPAATAAMTALVPGASAVLAIPVLGEWPGLYAWVGLGLVSAGIVLAAGWRSRQQQQFLKK